jgi:hypothetical protein
MSVGALTMLTLRARRRRVAILLAFAAVFLSAALTARMIGLGKEGSVEIDELFKVGGIALPSAILIIGWLLGRFPLIATLVLMSGIVSDDRNAGYARLYAVRPVSPLKLYGARFCALGGVVFVISAVLMPGFDLLMLSTWAGPATLILILAYLMAYGGLTALLSVWTRGDAWLTLLIALIALVWDTLRRADFLSSAPPGAREVVTFILPPQGALLELENAFGSLAPIPWSAFVYIAGYGAVMLILAGVSLLRREV